MDVINQVNQDWKQAIKQAEETGEGVDFSNLFASYSQNLVDLDQAFAEFKERLTKKKGFFK